ncbi:MAG: hypothetical protein ACO25F_02045 [Erythrobacter sp.]
MAELLMLVGIAAGAALVLLHHIWLVEDRLDEAAARILLRPLVAQVDAAAPPVAEQVPSIERGDAARTGADRAHAARRLVGEAGALQVARLLKMFDPVSDEVLARYRKFAGDLVSARR